MGDFISVARRAVERSDAGAVFVSERLFRLLFLVDWRAALEEEDSLSEIRWTAQGPVDLVGEIPPAYDDLHATLERKSGEWTNGDCSNYLAALAKDLPALAADALETIDYVMDTVGDMSWHELNRLVFSTRPMMAGPRRGNLDLRELAHQQRTQKALELA